MSIGSIGSSTSLWQQDQNYWNDQQSEASTTAATSSLITAMSNAMVTQAKGLASIANQTALNRTNSQLTAAIQNILSGGSTSSSDSSASSTSSSSVSAASPATGVGTASLTTSTTLASLGIPAGGSFTISSGGDTTTYASTGSDTVGNVLTAINQDYVGNAPVTASLNSSGRLVLKSKNDTNIIAVAGVYAGNIGFGTTNDNFKPTPGTPSPSSASTSSSTSATTSSAKTSTTSANTTKSYTTIAAESATSAASLLSDSGAGGSLVDMLA
jgi:hypothetical protein